ncbi:MAG: hypothetical protein IE909_10405 [Campylobacterales bacterium]|nr:hypothetical protein [Campylobacterales bacterium]
MKNNLTTNQNAKLALSKAKRENNLSDERNKNSTPFMLLSDMKYYYIYLKA